MTTTDDDFMSDEFEPAYESDEGVDAYEPELESVKKKAKKTTEKVEKTAKPAKPKTTAKLAAKDDTKTTTKAAKTTTKKEDGRVLTDFFGAASKETTSTIDTSNGDAEMKETNVSPVTPKKPEHRTVEEIYKKKTQLEHVLLRPDTYIGSTEAEEQEMWVFDMEEDMIKKKKIKYVPGLYKIVDEILVNAADNKIRDPEMNSIRVIIDRAQGFISIENNGKGIPVTIHKVENIYVPQLIFGQLLTSSNYDDNEKKVTGGRNGYGAKLCNIFSTEFTVETADKENQKVYRQVFSKNMSVTKEPRITVNKTNKEFTRISFKPDLSKFGMSELDEDFESLIKKRVYDLAGCVEGVNVYLNGTKIPVKGFPKYAELYTKSLEFRTKEGIKPIIFDKEGSNERWQVGFAVSDGQFNQISFVNSICTAKGGTHVNYVADQIIKAITPTVLKKCGKAKPFQIKNHMCIFVNCLINNPTFDSQTKENMTLRASSFGSTYKADPNFIKKVEKSGLIDLIANFVRFKEDQQMVQADRKIVRRLAIPKLEDANLAGRRPHNKDCTLILTEGDSAKALVLSGLSVVGRDKFGVFPLRGKLLNVREASNQKIKDNAEITNIKAILGLKHGEKYTSVSDLRYGKLMIMTDQDHDGSHIKGLVINFIDQMFPSLLDIPGFLLEFITPIIKCKKKRTKEEISFFTIPEYEKWAEENNQDRSWEPKYFKGLGTSDKKAAREYFGNLGLHRKEFHVADGDDRQLIEMAFSKTKVNDRKDWLLKYEPGIFIDHSVNKIKISDFVNQELMLFSMADNIRSIPSVVDGFKPGQRKVLFGTIKRGRNSEIKVAQLANYVAGVTQYHHGETSVSSTVIKMAQDFVGSNNINLLFPSGQFGTRHEGDSAAASPRYLFTRLSDITRYIYHPDDDDILKYLIEENMSIEPEWYIPIIPMVLVNGVEGIGTGWSTSIPNYNPRDITDNLLRLMNGEEVVPMKPWYRGFKGEIVPFGGGKYTVNGIASITDDSTIHVSEIPVRQMTEKFKENLDSLMEGKEKKSEITITSYSNNSTDSAVEFTVELEDKDLRKAEDIGLLKAFKITSSISINNLVCFDKHGKLKKYSSPEEVLYEFYDLRLEYYAKRKSYMISVLKEDYERLDNKARFLELVIKKEIIYVNRKEEDIVADMERHQLKRIYPRKKSALLTEDDEDVGGADNEDEDSRQKSITGSGKKGASDPDTTTPTHKKNSEGKEKNNGYEYLFSISVRGFTSQKVEELRRQRESKLKELEYITATAPKTFWQADLRAFLEQWNAILEDDEQQAKAAKPLASKTKTLKRKRVMKPKVKKVEAADSPSPSLASNE